MGNPVEDKMLRSIDHSRKKNGKNEFMVHVKKHRHLDNLPKQKTISGMTFEELEAFIIKVIKRRSAFNLDD